MDANYDDEVNNKWNNKNTTLVACIRTTQSKLGKYISRPPLLFKYLVQPPFLFFHDVITSVIRTTGFLEGLYTADELDRLKTRSLKENRINFIDKLIRALQMTTGERFRFHLAKMSVGSRPLSVNRLLHSIAYALDVKMSSDLAVGKINGGASNDNYTVKGTKRKMCEQFENEQEYFGDDEAEDKSASEFWANNKSVKLHNSRMDWNDNDDEIALAYENDIELHLGTENNRSTQWESLINNTTKEIESLSIYDATLYGKPRQM